MEIFSNITTYIQKNRNKNFITWSFVIYFFLFAVVTLILWTFQPKYLWLYDSKGKRYFSWIQLVGLSNFIAYLISTIFLWLTFNVVGYCGEVLENELKKIDTVAEQQENSDGNASVVLPIENLQALGNKWHIHQGKLILKPDITSNPTPPQIQKKKRILKK